MASKDPATLQKTVRDYMQGKTHERRLAVGEALLTEALRERIFGLPICWTSERLRFQRLRGFSHYDAQSLAPNWGVVVCRANRASSHT